MKTADESSYAGKTLKVEHLFLDSSTCTRCQETGRNLKAAIEAVKPHLSTQRIDLSLRNVLVKSAEQAIAERFQASPTVRVNGRDIAKLEETKCDACTDLCGCPEGTACRVWNYLGEQHQAAPVGLLIEAITAAASSLNEPATPHHDDGVFELPDNLRRFFAGKKLRELRADHAGTCCDAARCGCGGNCDCDDLESTTCGCHS